MQFFGEHKTRSMIVPDSCKEGSYGFHFLIFVTFSDIGDNALISFVMGQTLYIWTSNSLKNELIFQWVLIMKLVVMG